MIKVSGQAERSFIFPADLDTAFKFFQNISRLVGFLPHITLVGENPGSNHLRVHYATTELGAYLINIISDLEYQIDAPNYCLAIRAVDCLPAIKPTTTLNSTTARGYFTCDAQLLLGDKPDETLVVYSLTMDAKLPKPGGLRFMPGRVISGIVAGITNGRIKEIADGFVQNSVQVFSEEYLAGTA